jgi:SAM-dependent methyltransferase
VASNQNTCRLCQARLRDGAPLTFDPAPAGAQHFLERPDTTDRSDAIALRIVECSECGLVQSAGPAVPYYRNVITAAGVSPAMRAHRLAQVRAFAAAHGLAGRSGVEIGCHSGYFLDILAEAGLKPYGTEFGGVQDPVTSHPIIDAYPEPGVTIPCGPFAAFFCLNFLEHSPDPKAFLRGIRENLTPDGVGLIEVPNYAQQRRLGRVFDYIADHLSYFDANTLALALRLAGFVVERLEETRGGENLEVWIRVRPSADLPKEAEVIKHTQANLRQWLGSERGAARRVAVWGASHQALTLLAQVRNDDVVAIFDSAPFKQGKFAPVTRLPILKPTADAVRHADTILIVAAGYEAEIARILRRDLDFNGGIFQMQNGAPAAMPAQE